MSEEISRAQKALEALLGDAKTLFVTVPSTEDGLAEIGVSPFIQQAGHIYIYASDLSAHVRHLQSVPKATFMVISDESQSQNIWARHRLKFQATVSEVPRADERFETACDDIRSAHGPVMDLIRNFSDFHLFEITPKTGVFVSGFGAAFDVLGADLVLGDKLTRS